MMVDMAHISGLVAGGVADSPFHYADVVTSTTHKSLRGPRSGLIFAKNHLMDRINSAVFPGLQGGPHNNNIAALAVALKEAESDDFKKYVKQVIENARTLAESLVSSGMTLVTGGTDNHLMLWDLRPMGLSGGKAERVMERCSITVNKNALVGDKSAVKVGGVRLGVCALTSRGMDGEDMKKVAGFLVRATEIGLKVDERCAKDGKKTLKDFAKKMESDEGLKREVDQLRGDVEAFAKGFIMPGEELADL